METLMKEATLRTAREEDYAAVSALHNLCWPEEPETAEEMLESDLGEQPLIKRGRYVVEREGEILASGRYLQYPGRYHPERFWLEMDVHPEHRCTGIGTQLIKMLIEDVRHHGGKLARVALSDDRKDEIAFYERRGFAEEWRSWEQELVIDGKNAEEARQSGEELLASAGCTWCTMMEAFERGLEHECYLVHEQTRQETDWNDPVTEWGLENFSKAMRTKAELTASFVALLDGKVVALSNLELAEEGAECVNHGWTGVHPDHRRKGLARGLKHLVLAAALGRGYKRILTTSNGSNLAMMRLNAELGFTKAYAWVYLAKALEAAPVVREMEVADYEHVARVRNYTLTEPLTVDLLHSRDKAWNPTWFRKRWVAEVDGEVVACAQMSQSEAFQPDRYFFVIDVHPAWRGKGIGKMFADKIEEYARSQNGREIMTFHRDDMPEVEGFLLRRGFEFHQHLFEGLLDTEKMDFEAIQRATEKVTSSGIQIKRWSELEDTKEQRLKLHDLHNVSDRSTPGWESWGDTPYEMFEMEFFGTSRHDPNAILVAFDGDEMVGLSTVCKLENDEWSTVYTGTLPSHRGRGIGYALKGLATLYAKESGAKVVRAQNDKRNEPMLAINGRLGFKPQFGWVHVKKALGSSPCREAGGGG